MTQQLTPWPWDLAFTRMSEEVLVTVNRCAFELTRLLSASALFCDLRQRLTPRGTSTFLSVVGQRGLIFIVDFTIVYGMAASGRRGVFLDVRLLDACGDVVAWCSPEPHAAYYSSAKAVVEAAGGGLSATALHMISMGHFDIVH